MANIFTYLDWRGDLDFVKSPLNEVDCYIICQIGCPDFSGILPRSGTLPLGEAVDRYFERNRGEKQSLGVLSSPSTLPMLRRLPDTERFRPLLLHDYVNYVDFQESIQFSALTVELPDGTPFVTFRGTDDTLAAWKEDFLLSVEEPVPAQEYAGEYLRSQAERFPGRPLLVGGHSKGGNLAVYAALVAPEEVQERLTAVYNFDGPGFRTDRSATPEYRRLKPRLHTVVSQHTIVGKLLYHEDDCEIVRSNQAGPSAHDGFNWEVLGTGFVRCLDYSLASKSLAAAVAEQTGHMDAAERLRFIDELFSILGSTGAVTLSDLTESKLRSSLEIAQGLRKSPEVKEFIRSMISLTLRETAENVHANFRIPEIKGIRRRKKK